MKVKGKQKLKIGLTITVFGVITLLLTVLLSTSTSTAQDDKFPDFALDVGFSDVFGPPQKIDVYANHTLIIVYSEHTLALCNGTLYLDGQKVVTFITWDVGR